jgi:ParB family chromosome partitioning protein
LGYPRSAEDADDHKPLSDILIRDLTAHRTLGLRLALSEQPDVTIVAVTHALSAQIFYRGADAHVIDIRPASTLLASHADGIEDTKRVRHGRVSTPVGRRRCRVT